MPTLPRWSGVEIRMLREAMRMSVREFASHLGISSRMVSKWEAGGADIFPRPSNQAVLDQCLSLAGIDAQRRFKFALDERSTVLSVDTPGGAFGAQNHIRHPIDGRPMVLVSPGIFLAGAQNEPRWMEGFYIDVFPVTNADYARFVSATGRQAPPHWAGAEPPRELADHPVVFVSWMDASGYATWARKSLPTSNQWEMTARGSRGDVYPWGNQSTPAKCNVRENGIGHTTPVNRFHSGVSLYGAYDLCGNVWEWCGTETQPGRFVLKGGAFTSPFSRATPSAFNDASRYMMDDDTGFRCATSVEAMDQMRS